MDQAESSPSPGQPGPGQPGRKKQPSRTPPPETAAEERLISALVGEEAAADTRSKFRRMLRNGEFEQKEIEVAVSDSGGNPIGQLDLPGMPPDIASLLFKCNR